LTYTRPQIQSDASSTKLQLAERYAPVLVMWREIPALPNPSARLRQQHARLERHSSSRALSGAHINRDFHPRDVRLVLDHAQAWDPRPPLPVLPTEFTRLYRDFARFFFWPIAGTVIAALLIITFAQGLQEAPRTSIEIGTLVLLGALYLVTLRSPILTPVDSWHHLNHVLIAGGLMATWYVIFGIGTLWYLGLIIAAPSAVLLLTSFLIREVTGFAGFVILPLRWLRGLALWMLNRRAHYPPKWRRSRVIQGLKPAHEYTEDSEFFFRHPRDGKPMYRADRSAYWSAYSRILARDEEKYPVTYYARVLDPNADGITAIQYWFCYYYNDWANEHECDWETAVVFLREDQPVAVAASSHEAGEVRDWRHVRQKDGHPILYVAAGSHAFYFQPGAFLAERAVAGLRVTSLDAALFGRQILDYVDFTADGLEGDAVSPGQVLLIPEPDPSSGLWGHPDHDHACQGDCPFNLEWLNYKGRWGSVGVSLVGGFSGPRGPVAAGLVWENPFLWADAVCRPCSTCNGDVNHRWRD
jgi:hypothetical protein